MRALLRGEPSHVKRYLFSRLKIVILCPPGLRCRLFQFRGFECLTLLVLAFGQVLGLGSCGSPRETRASSWLVLATSVHFWLSTTSKNRSRCFVLLFIHILGLCLWSTSIRYYPARVRNEAQAMLDNFRPRILVIRFWLQVPWVLVPRARWLLVVSGSINLTALNSRAESATSHSAPPEECSLAIDIHTMTQVPTICQTVWLHKSNLAGRYA